MEGRIIRISGGLYTIATAENEISCKAKGAFRHEGSKPMVGDIVTIRGSDGECQIESILDRKNALIRPPVANLDKLFIVCAAKCPEPILLTIDKLTVIARINGIEPVIIITKADLDDKVACEIADIYKKCGFKTFVYGLQSDKSELTDYIKNECLNDIIAFAGNSGVGKSTLLNSLFPSLKLETGEVSIKTERGKHTTRAVELYPFSDLLGIERASGYIADTPGFSMLDFVRFDFINKEDLPGAFYEFNEYLGRCKYTKCTHTVDEGCAVLDAVDKGLIPQSRHRSYLSLYNDVKNKHDWDK